MKSIRQRIMEAQKQRNAMTEEQRLKAMEKIREIRSRLETNATTTNPATSNSNKTVIGETR
jgi:hypothetical protein